jgi:hypothetical protein
MDEEATEKFLSYLKYQRFIVDVSPFHTTYQFRAESYLLRAVLLW